MSRPPTAEQGLLDQLRVTIANGERITLIVGPGLAGPSATTVPTMLELAERYAAGRNDDMALSQALARARAGTTDEPAALYDAYRAAFRDWVSRDALDVVAQQAVLAAYQPPDVIDSPLATHGLWQLIDHALGERLENDRDSWILPAGARALGALLARRRDVFGGAVLTTAFDPLLEIAARSAYGRAVSVLLEADMPAGDELRVVHLNGYWRPLHGGPRRGLRLGEPRSEAWPPWLLDGDTICVVGCDDPDGRLRGTLARAAAERPLRVLWAESAERGRPDTGEPWLRHYRGVNPDEFFPALAGLLDVPWRDRTGSGRHRHRQLDWERTLVSVLDPRPPDSSDGLVRWLERRFGWRSADVTGGSPTTVFWPVRLRRRASLINLVQALAAGALAARGARVVVSMDDFDVPDHTESVARFHMQVRRWMRQIFPDAEPVFVSLRDELELPARAGDLLRPIDPWRLAQEFYGEPNSSIYSKLAAVKVLPTIPLREVEENAGAITQSLLRNNASRLLTPMSIWAHLHRLLLDTPAERVVTLGGLDEQLFWRQWADTFGFGAGHLYNPHIRSLSHHSALLQWTSEQDALDSVRALLDLPGWADHGGFLPWLVENAFLLPAHLTGDQPVLAGRAIDSWDSFLDAAEGDWSVWGELVHRVSARYLG